MWGFLSIIRAMKETMAAMKLLATVTVSTVYSPPLIVIFVLSHQKELNHKRGPCLETKVVIPGKELHFPDSDQGLFEGEVTPLPY